MDMDVIMTGASRGIGAALARALPASVRLHAVARDRRALEELARERPGTTVHVADLSCVEEAARVGSELAGAVSEATLVHNAGVWPAKRELVGGLERAFVVNCLAPLALQRPLLERRRLRRILVIGAGLMVKGRFDAARTPTGADFSWFRTYASTKLAFAAAMRDVARAHPDVDVAVIHPGVVRTDLGARGGLLGWLVARVKRRWETPERCAERLVRVLARDRWSPSPGEARWFFEDRERPWPEIVEQAAPAVRAALAAEGGGRGATS
jgi:short-subunit dehydrogenase